MRFHFMKLFTLILLVIFQMNYLNAQIKSNSDDGVFAPRKKIILKIARSNTASAIKALLNVKDFYGKTIVNRQLNWNAGQKELEIPLNISVNGYFEARVSGGKSMKYIYPFVIIPAPETIPNSENPFGVNFHLTRIRLALAKREIDMAKRIGIGWGRGMICDFGDITRKKDFSKPGWFGRWTKLINLVKDSGISCLGGIHFMPKWASGAPKEANYGVFSRVMPDDTSVVEDFCKAIARDCSFVKYWEVANEPDANNFWRGRWKSGQSGDHQKIIKDYVDFLKAASKGFHQGNPESKVLYGGITSAVEDGHTYQPFVATTFKHGAGDAIDIMNIHYTKSIADILKLTNNIRKPIWVTELGGSSALNRGGDYNEMFEDTTHSVIQLADGAVKVFKYDFRNDGVKPNEKEHNYGLVRRDFSPKPAYVAFATTIRLLKKAEFSKALNVTKWSDKGWLRGYEFIKEGKYINCMWLNVAKQSKVTLRSSDKELTMIDLMGNSNNLTPVNGTVTVSAGKLPFYVIGKLQPDSGPVVLPVDQLISKKLLPLRNVNFEHGINDTGIKDWHSGIGARGALRTITPGYHSRGAAEISVKKPGLNKFIPCFYQRIDWLKCRPTLKKGEYLKLSLEAMAKSTEVTGRGICLTYEFFNSKGTRIKWKDTPFRWGTYDWTKLKTLSIEVPPQTVKIGVSLYFAPKTYGKVEIDDIKLSVERWKKAMR